MSTDTPDDRLLRSKSVCHLLDDCSLMSLWRYRQDPDFPQPIYLTKGGPPHWWGGDIRHWARRRARRLRAPSVAETLEAMEVEERKAAHEDAA